MPGEVGIIFVTTPRLSLGPTLLSSAYRWFFPRVKAARTWSWHSHQSIAEIRNAWRFTATLPIHLRSVVLKRKDNFSFYLRKSTIGLYKFSFMMNPNFLRIQCFTESSLYISYVTYVKKYRTTCLLVTLVPMCFCFSTLINITLTREKISMLRPYYLFNTSVHSDCPFLFAIQQVRTQQSEYWMMLKVPTTTYATRGPLIKHLSERIV